MLPASFECEGAAKKIGRRTAAPGAQPKRGVDRILREEILEPERWAARIIAQLQAAINAVHADAPTIEQTDWSQIVALYDHLLALAPHRSSHSTARSPSVRCRAPLPRS